MAKVFALLLFDYNFKIKHEIKYQNTYFHKSTV